MKLLPGILLIVTGILLFLATGLQVFSLSLVFEELYTDLCKLEIFKRGLVILALYALAFLSLRAGLHITKKQ